MRPCLGIVILVGAVEVPGAGDRLVCGHSEGGGGVERVTGGRVVRGEQGDRRRRVRVGAACGVVYDELGALAGVEEGVRIMSKGCFTILPGSVTFLKGTIYSPKNLLYL